MLQRLLTDQRSQVHPKGVRLAGVKIIGHLDLEAATIHCPLFLTACHLDELIPVNLRYANASVLALRDCYLAGLTGDALTVSTRLDLTGSTFLQRPLSLPGAQITGEILCSGAYLTARDEQMRALDAHGITVRGELFLDDGFTAAGVIDLVGGNITGSLDCSGATLSGSGKYGCVLSAGNVKVGHDIVLQNTLAAGGAIGLVGANITGSLVCSGATLSGADQDGYALSAGNVKVGQDILLQKTLAPGGAIRLIGADITGSLDCSGATLSGADQDGYVLCAGNIKVGHDIVLQNTLAARGAIGLVGANITGSLVCSGATLSGADQDGYALSAGNVKVGQDILLQKTLAPGGAIRLIGADITGSLACDGAKIDGVNKENQALAAYRIRVGGDVYLKEGFVAQGAIDLVGADITGSLDCPGATLSRAGKDGIALLADRMRVGGDMSLGKEGGDPKEFTTCGAVSLRSANVGGKLHLSMETTRPKFILDGFTYTGLEGSGVTDLKERLAWIRSGYEQKPTMKWIDTLTLEDVIKPADKGVTSYASQPYEQLTRVYQQAGQTSDARRIAIAGRVDRRVYGGLKSWRKVPDWLLDKSIKYGYQAWRAGAGLALVLIAFWVLSIIAQHHHLMEPVGAFTGNIPSAANCHVNPGYPCFYPFGYAVDIAIPIINVHQATYWGPNEAAWVAGNWITTGLGWALATLFVAGYTGLVRKD